MLLGNRDTQAVTALFGHRNEHIMIVCKILVSCLEKTHTRPDAHSQSDNCEMNFGDGQTKNG